MLAGQRPDVCNMEEQRGRLGLISLSGQHARVCVFSTCCKNIHSAEREDNFKGLFEGFILGFKVRVRVRVNVRV